MKKLQKEKVKDTRPAKKGQSSRLKKDASANQLVHFQLVFQQKRWNNLITSVASEHELSRNSKFARDCTMAMMASCLKTQKQTLENILRFLTCSGNM